MARVLPGRFTNNCNHAGKDNWILIKTIEIAFCRKCGYVFYGDEWFDPRVLIVALLVDEDDNLAMNIFHIREKLRKSRLIRYTYIPEQELRNAARRMKRELERSNS